MRKTLVGVAALALLVSAQALADTGFGTKALVVSVDTKAMSVTLTHTDDKDAWVQTVATWDGKTEWEDASANQWEPKAATAELVKSLKKDSKVYVRVNDRGTAGKYWLELLKVLPSTAEMK